ncbi:MAG: ribbon-helix-helix domain-containing protein [Acidobacteria bacterium]|nr:ribbon-helix-helix domain-containing protein [Acidobacteriota bacterium]
MKRTQLYLDEDIWKALHIRSRQSGTSISELVRQAVRDKYGSSPANRRKAMQAWVGIWKDRKDLPSTEAYVRQLRKGGRRRRRLGI